MVRQRLIALLLALGAIGAQTARADLAADTPPAATVTRLTWLDCVRLTTKTNPDLQSSREAVLNSDAVRLGAYSALYPQISASFGDSRSYAGNNLFAERNYSTSYTEQISLSQLIFNGFATQANIAQARAQLNLAFANLDAQKAGTSFELKTAFAQLLDAQQLIAISGNVVGIRQDNARLVKLLYEGGSEDKGAMLLSQANLDQAQVNLDQARRTRDLAVRQLATILGQNLTPPVEAQGDLQTAPLAATPNFSKLATATPIYFQQRARVDAAAAGITLAQSGWYPTITAGASADRSDAHFPCTITAGRPASPFLIRSSRAAKPTSTSRRPRPCCAPRSTISAPARTNPRSRSRKPTRRSSTRRPMSASNWSCSTPPRCATRSPMPITATA